jgi:hypothetical protein
MTKNQAATLVSDKAAELIRGMSLDELLAVSVDTGHRYSTADRKRLEDARDRVVTRLLKMHNY